MSNRLFKTPDELQVALGERIKRLRLNRNLDQKSTAEKAGISERALRNLESGRGYYGRNNAAHLEGARLPAGYRYARTRG
jgi:transcriptional regulator with XRE-family HTH domain